MSAYKILFRVEIGMDKKPDMYMKTLGFVSSQDVRAACLELYTWLSFHSVVPERTYSFRVSPAQDENGHVYYPVELLGFRSWSADEEYEDPTDETSTRRTK